MDSDGCVGYMLVRRCRRETLNGVKHRICSSGAFRLPLRSWTVATDCSAWVFCCVWAVSHRLSRQLRDVVCGDDGIWALRSA